jgi:ArsR family transcriptional regulator
MHRVNVDLHEIFYALSDQYRVRIIRLLLETRSELCLCELSESLAEPEYKLSRHIKILKSHGLLTSVRDGKWVYHSLVKDQNFLKSIYRAFSQFSGNDLQLKVDMQRFQKRLKLRLKGRCQLPSKILEDRDLKVRS